MNKKAKPSIVWGETRMEIIPPKGYRIVKVYETPEGRVFVWWDKCLWEQFKTEEADRDG
jgi:hypothetical protein